MMSFMQPAGDEEDSDSDCGYSQDTLTAAQALLTSTLLRSHQIRMHRKPRFELR